MHLFNKKDPLEPYMFYGIDGITHGKQTFGIILELTQNGILDKDGRLTSKFDFENPSLGLSDKYKHVEKDLIGLLRGSYTILYYDKYNDGDKFCAKIPNELVDIVKTYDDIYSYLDIKKYDMAIIDIDVNKENELAVLQKIKKNHENLPVIIYSATHDVKHIRTAMKNGANNYVVKSKNTDDLYNAIKNAKLYERYGYYVFKLLDDLKNANYCRGKMSDAISKSHDLANEVSDKFVKDFIDLQIPDFSLQDCYHIISGTYVPGIEEKQIKDVKLNEKSKHITSNNNKIIIIDDDDMLRSLLKHNLKKMFESKGYPDINILEAQTASRGIEMFDMYKDEICMAVIDMRMPYDKNDMVKQQFKPEAGVDVLRIIKGFEQRVECVILTGYADTYQLCECFRLGAYELCDKDNKDFYKDTIFSAYKKALDNFEKYVDTMFTLSLCFRVNFFTEFSRQVIEKFEKEGRKLSKEEETRFFFAESVMDIM